VAASQLCWAGTVAGAGQASAQKTAPLLSDGAAQSPEGFFTAPSCFLGAGALAAGTMFAAPVATAQTRSFGSVVDLTHTIAGRVRAG
jgi:hypothetical protein